MSQLWAGIITSGVNYFSGNNIQYNRIRVRRSVRNQNERFNATIRNIAGSHAQAFNVGDEVRIYHDVGSPPTAQIFLGEIERVEYKGRPNNELIEIEGRNFMSSLNDVIVQNVYSSVEVGSIVRDLVWQSPFSGLIGVSNVGSTTFTPKAIKFKNRTVREAINVLGDFVGYESFVDFNKDLNFQPLGDTSAGVVLRNGVNATITRFTKDRKEMANFIRVYGDRTIARTTESFTADGAGSVFTLQEKPHDTLVKDAGTVKKGGVFELTSFLATGTQYLVDFDQKKIIFTSGTEAGDNIPASGNTVLVEYGNSNPIVKEVQDDDSIVTYRMKQLYITNMEIKDPRHALEVAKAELELRRIPPVEATVSVKSFSISGIQPGNTVQAFFPDQNVSGTFFSVREIDYDITQNNLLAGETIRLRMGTLIRDTSEELRDIILRQRQLEAQDTDEFDTISRYKTATGSMGLQANWFVKTRTTGSSFVLGHVTRGDLGSGTDQADPQTYLGDSRSALTIVASGGEF